jgi:hypothetical protein
MTGLLQLVTAVRQAIYGRRPTLAHPYGGEDMLEPGFEPETTYQKKDDENRTWGTISAAGDNIVLARQNNYDAQVLEVTIQPVAAVTAYIKSGDQGQISAAYSLGAGEKWSAPGRIVGRSFDLFVNLSAAVSTVFEVRWKPAYGRN